MGYVNSMTCVGCKYPGLSKYFGEVVKRWMASETVFLGDSSRAKLASLEIDGRNLSS